jgi:hypothetical protein
MPSILTITCDELDDMRVKLLAAVLTSGWQGDMAQDALTPRKPWGAFQPAWKLWAILRSTNGNRSGGRALPGCQGETCFPPIF